MAATIDPSEIDQSSIKTPSISHDDIDISSVKPPEQSLVGKVWDSAKDKASQIKNSVSEELPRLGNAAVDQLPTIGAAGGGLLGSLEGGVGAIPGAAVGSAAGKGLQNVIRGYQQNGKDYLRSPPTAQGLLQGTKDIAGAAAGGAAQEMGGQVLGSVIQKAAPYIKDAASSALSKGSSWLTGIPEDIIKTYAKNADQINKTIEESGGDMTEAADQARQKLYSGIQQVKQDLNGKISKFLEQTPETESKMIDPKPIIDKLESFKNNIDETYNPEARGEIDEMVSRINQKAGEDKALSPQDLYKTQQYLYDQASGSYLKAGQIFSNSKSTQIAAKQAASTTRKLLNEASPEIASINGQLAQLHGVESSINRNLIASGKPDAALFAAGSGSNPRNAQMLQKLGDITGQDALGTAKNLAAAKQFSNPSLFPVDTTGKSMTRMAGGGFLGGAAAKVMGLPPQLGAYAGMAATSPVATKGLINAGRSVAPALAPAASIATNPQALGLLGRKAIGQ